MHGYHDFRVSDHVRDDNYDKEDELNYLKVRPSDNDGSKLRYSNHSRASAERPAEFNIVVDPPTSQIHSELAIEFEEAGETDLVMSLEMSFGYLGRMVIPLIYANFVRFIQLQPTVNLVAVTIDLIAMTLSGYSPPLTPVHVLWANLILDTLGGEADQRSLQGSAQRNVGAGTHDIDELQIPHAAAGADQGSARPLAVSKAILTKSRLLQAAYQIVVLLTIHFRGQQLLRVIELQGPNIAATAGDRAIVNTIIFNAFAFCQLFEAINARSLEAPARRLTNIFRGLLDIDKQRRFMGFWVTALMLQVVMVEFLHYFASTVKLSWKYWVLCTVLGFLNWPIALVGKFIPRRGVPDEIEEEAP